MKQRPRIVKDKKVRAFVASVRTVWGFERVFKSYVCPYDARENCPECSQIGSRGHPWWAYVRHLSQTEVMRARQIQSPETIQFVMAYSPKITTDLYMEFGERTYKIVSIDPFESISEAHLRRFGSAKARYARFLGLLTP